MSYYDCFACCILARDNCTQTKVLREREREREEEEEEEEEEERRFIVPLYGW